MSGVVKALFGGGGRDPRADAIAETQKRQLAEQDAQRAELEQANAGLATRLGRNARRGALAFAETGEAGLKSTLGG